jgi:hypothetical protein
VGTAAKVGGRFTIRFSGSLTVSTRPSITSPTVSARAGYTPFPARLNDRAAAMRWVVQPRGSSGRQPSDRVGHVEPGTTLGLAVADKRVVHDGCRGACRSRSATRTPMRRILHPTRMNRPDAPMVGNHVQGAVGLPIAAAGEAATFGAFRPRPKPEDLTKPTQLSPRPGSANSPPSHRTLAQPAAATEPANVPRNLRRVIGDCVWVSPIAMVLYDLISQIGLVDRRSTMSSNRVIQRCSCRSAIPLT